MPDLDTSLRPRIGAATKAVVDSSPTLPDHPSGNNASVSVPSSLTVAAGAKLDLTAAYNEAATIAEAERVKADADVPAITPPLAKIS